MVYCSGSSRMLSCLRGISRSMLGGVGWSVGWWGSAVVAVAMVLGGWMMLLPESALRMLLTSHSADAEDVTAPALASVPVVDEDAPVVPAMRIVSVVAAAAVPRTPVPPPWTVISSPSVGTPESKGKCLISWSSNICR